MLSDKNHLFSIELQMSDSMTNPCEIKVIAVIPNNPIGNSVAVLSYPNYLSNKQHQPLKFMLLSTEKTKLIFCEDIVTCILHFPKLNLLVVKQLDSYRLIPIDPISKFPTVEKGKFLRTPVSFNDVVYKFGVHGHSRRDTESRLHVVLSDSKFVGIGLGEKKEEKETKGKTGMEFTSTDPEDFFQAMLDKLKLNEGEPQCLLFVDVVSLTFAKFELPFERKKICRVQRCGDKLLVGGENELLVLDWKKRIVLSHIKDLTELFRTYNLLGEKEEHVFMKKTFGLRIFEADNIDIFQGLLNTNLVVVYDKCSFTFFVVDVEDKKVVKKWRQEEEVNGTEVFNIRNCLVKTGRKANVLFRYRLDLGNGMICKDVVDERRKVKQLYVFENLGTVYYISLENVKKGRYKMFSKVVESPTTGEVCWGEVRVGRERNYDRISESAVGDDMERVEYLLFGICEFWGTVDVRWRDGRIKIFKSLCL